MEIRANIAGLLPTRDLATLAQTNRTHGELARSPYVVLQQSHVDQRHSLRHLVDIGAIDALCEVLRMPACKLDWVDTPDAQNRTALDAAFDNRDHAMLACLANIPPRADSWPQRLQLVYRTIANRDQMALSHLLSSLSPAVREAQHERILRTVAACNHGPSIREVLKTAGPLIFTRLSDGGTALHLGLWENEEDVDWLLRQPGAMQALRQSDGEGRTPLLRAAERVDLVGLNALARHYPGGEITDTNFQGRGVLQSVFADSKLSALRLIDDADWLARTTLADRTGMLVATLDALATGDYDKTFADSDADDAFCAHTDVIRTLLSLPAGKIDIHVQVPSLGGSIMEVLRDDRLTTILQDACSLDRSNINHTVEETFEEYDNADFLERAKLHL